jgi:hypothetical protein
MKPVLSGIRKLNIPGFCDFITAYPFKKEDAELNFGGITILPVESMYPYFPSIFTGNNIDWLNDLKLKQINIRKNEIRITAVFIIYT